MELSMAKFVKDVDSSPLQYNAKSGWQEITRGLVLVVRGYCVLIAGGVLAPLLIGLAQGEGPASLRQSLTQENRDDLLLLGLVTVGLTALLSYGLVLLGQWRCLMYAPERQGAKELMYVCLNLVLMASLMNVAGAVLDGSRTYAALRQGPAWVERLDYHSAGTLLQLGSAVVGLLASLIFSQFLRTVAHCFNDRSRVRSVDFNLAFLGLLLGGSFGTFLCVQRLASKAEMVPWLAAGWLFCFAWHLWLVNRVRQSVRDALQEDHKLQVDVAPQALPATVRLHTLSGLRRMARAKAEADAEAAKEAAPDAACSCEVPEPACAARTRFPRPRAAACRRRGPGVNQTLARTAPPPPPGTLPRYPERPRVPSAR